MLTGSCDQKKKYEKCGYNFLGHFWINLDLIIMVFSPFRLSALCSLVFIFNVFTSCASLRFPEKGKIFQLSYSMFDLIFQTDLYLSLSSLCRACPENREEMSDRTEGEKNQIINNSDSESFLPDTNPFAIEGSVDIHAFRQQNWH